MALVDSINEVWLHVALCRRMELWTPEGVPEYPHTYLILRKGYYLSLTSACEYTYSGRPYQVRLWPFTPQQSPHGELIHTRQLHSCFPEVLEDLGLEELSSTHIVEICCTWMFFFFQKGILSSHGMDSKMDSDSQFYTSCLISKADL